MSGLRELKDLLDDVAGDAVGAGQVDPAAVRARGAAPPRPRILRLLSSRTALLAAAAAVIGVLVPSLLVLTTVHPPTPQRQAPVLPGPGRWAWLPEDDVPPLAAGQMARAAMVLGMPLARDSRIGSSMTVFPPQELSRPPVVVSADGRTYARLPWPAGSGLIALSRDGSRVAWVSVVQRGKKVTTTVHQVRLADSVVHSRTLPAETIDERPTHLTFATVDGDGLLVGTRFRSGANIKGQEHLWRVPAATTAPIAAVCTCRASELGLDPDGRLWQGRVPSATVVPGIRRSPARSITPTVGWNGIESPRLLVGTDGAGVRNGSYLRSTGKGLPIESSAGTRRVPVNLKTTGDPWVTLLDLQTDGVLASVLPKAGLRITAGPARFVAIDPGTGRVRTLAHGDARAMPLAVSAAGFTGGAFLTGG